jgi:hypothetical protein
VYALHSRISALDYTVELKVECPDINVNDASFMDMAVMIDDHNTVQDFLACEMYPLASSFGFRDVTVGTTTVSKVKAPLPVFPIEPVSTEDAGRLLTKVETNIERTLGNFVPNKHNALATGKLLNDGRLNWVFEQMGILYTPRPLPGTKASQAATHKCKADMSKKATTKKPRVALCGKVTPVKTVAKRYTVKVIHPKGKPWAEMYVRNRIASGEAHRGI